MIIPAPLDDDRPANTRAESLDFLRGDNRQRPVADRERYSPRVPDNAGSPIFQRARAGGRDFAVALIHGELRRRLLVALGRVIAMERLYVPLQP
jgi:hypothetical protein